MKKLSLILLLTFMTTAIFAESKFPYSKVLTMSRKELVEEKFKYSLYKNQNVLSDNEYSITIQYGDKGIASVRVVFYDDANYLEINDFANTKGQNLESFEYNNQETLKYEYGDYNFELKSKANRTLTDLSDSTVKEHVYYRYTYIIYTGNEANSQYMEAQAKKEARRKARGAKKRKASDFM